MLADRQINRACLRLLSLVRRQFGRSGSSRKGGNHNTSRWTDVLLKINTYVRVRTYLTIHNR